MALLIAGRLTPTNVALHDACASAGVRSRLLPPEVAAQRAQADELVLGRVDVRPGLDGVEPGLGALRRLEEQGFCVLNSPAALQAAHDKLETAYILRGAGLPHPPTVHVRPGDEDVSGLEPPYVVKPRFGSWGKDVFRCESERALRRTLAMLRERPWYEKDGALVQELVSVEGFDIRLVVAGGVVVGAVSRVAAPGEWRTNVALGGRRRRVAPDEEATALAIAAVTAVGGDLMGVDLLPTPNGFVVLEVNGCADFTNAYALGSRDVFREAILNLVFPGLAWLAGVAVPAPVPLEVPVE